MNSKEKTTLAGLNVHVEYIRETLIRLEGKIDELEKQTIGLLKWKWKIIGVSIGGATIISIIISAVTLILKFIK